MPFPVNERRSRNARVVDRVGGAEGREARDGDAEEEGHERDSGRPGDVFEAVAGVVLGRLAARHLRRDGRHEHDDAHGDDHGEKEPADEVAEVVEQRRRGAFSGIPSLLLERPLDAGWGRQGRIGERG